MPLRALSICGSFRGWTGHDRHVREFVREFARQGLEIELADFPMWSSAKLPNHMRDPWFASLNQPCGAKIALHFCMPHQVRRASLKRIVNYTMFEGTRIPSAWARASQGHARVVVPSESSRRAWIAGGTPEQRVRICPLGVDPALFSAAAEPLQLRRQNGDPVSQYRVRVLHISDLGPRKNVPGLLRSWIRATTARDDAMLLIKAGAAPGAMESFRARLSAIERESGKALRDAAPVHIFKDVLPDAAMPNLYAAATHYISMSFGEGWDLPMMEAAAAGLKTIAPNHSAYQAYLDPASAILIPSREVPAAYSGDSATALLFANANWWEPDQDEASRLIRSAIDGGDAWQASPRERILREFTWEKAARRLVEILSEVEDERKRFFSWPRWYRSAAAESKRFPPVGRPSHDRS